MNNLVARLRLWLGAKMVAIRKIASLLLFVACLLGSGPAWSGKRVALVIGNSTYESVPKLGNPANDAALIADTFKTAGFNSVELRRNLKINEMRRALRDFVDQSQDADVAVVYYAGHGIEVDGVNYIIPVDAVLERDVDIYDEAFSLDRLLISIEPARQLRLVILDACRDNPFAKTMKRTISSRGIGRGLAKVEPASPNTLIAFASKAGSTALDGDGKNSPFTAALVKHVITPGLDLRRAFGYVRDDVLKATGNRQEPYVYGSLGGDDVPLVPASPAKAGPQADPQVVFRHDYELALQLGTRDGWEAFLSQYPEGFYANLARGQLKKVAAEEVRAAAAEKARLAEQEKARLVAEGARAAELAKAAATAKAAEEARVAAEKAKQIAQDKAAAAERARLAEQEKAAAAERARAAEQERAQLAAEKAQLAAEKAKLAEQEKLAAVELARLAGEKTAAEEKQRIATLSPADSGDQRANLPRALQAELRRVGCNTGAVDGNWDDASEKALDLFNKHAGMRLDVKTASADALDAVKSKDGRICPLVCDVGYRVEGNRCEKVTCSSGYELNESGACEKNPVKKPPSVVRHVPSVPERPEQAYAGCNVHYNKCLGLGGRTCEQRLSICQRTGRWTDRFGQVHLMR